MPHTNPSDANSTTYEIPMANLGDETPKEWLLFKKRLTWCMPGQNTTGGATKYTLASRRLLIGRTLASLNKAATIQGNKSLANYTRCIQEVTLEVLPQKSLQDQKRWIRCFLKKTQGHAGETTLPE